MRELARRRQTGLRPISSIRLRGPRDRFRRPAARIARPLRRRRRRSAWPEMRVADAEQGSRTDHSVPSATERTLLPHAWSGSPGVDAVVTALVLAASRLQLAPRATIGPIRLRRGACALVAMTRPELRTSGAPLCCGRANPGETGRRSTASVRGSTSATAERSHADLRSGHRSPDRSRAGSLLSSRSAWGTSMGRSRRPVTARSGGI